MLPLYSAQINTDYGKKDIAVYCCDVTEFPEEIDILTTSAFKGSYAPTPGTLFEALYNKGVSVRRLAIKPDIDLREFSNIWLSDEIADSDTGIHRIGCVELRGFDIIWYDECKEDQFLVKEQFLIDTIRSYFLMLDMAAVHNVKMDTVVLPLLGSGSQSIDANMMIVPLINECINFLKRNLHVNKLYFVERNEAKAQLIAEYMKKSYSILSHSSAAAEVVQQENKPFAFISYASEDKNIADNLCSKLERRGVQVWYAPRDVRGPYAEAIAKAIDKATHFVVILSENSMKSQHVLNEIDLAFQGLPNNIKFKPLRIDESIFTPSFKYYLSRQHWLDAIVPPLEDRLNEFVESILADI